MQKRCWGQIELKLKRNFYVQSLCKSINDRNYKSAQIEPASTSIHLSSRLKNFSVPSVPLPSSSSTGPLKVSRNCSYTNSEWICINLIGLDQTHSQTPSWVALPLWIEEDDHKIPFQLLSFTNDDDNVFLQLQVLPNLTWTAANNNMQCRQDRTRERVKAPDDLVANQQKLVLAIATMFYIDGHHRRITKNSSSNSS